MKLILALSALAALVVAQDLNSLPDCGKTCVNNMLAKSGELGCNQGDKQCYCTNPNFANGLRDCSAQACGAAVQGQVLAFGRSYCAGVTGGATTTTVTSSSSSSGATDSASSVSSSASSALESAKSSASSAVSSVASSLSSAASSAASRATGGGATSSSSGSFAMKTQAPLAAVGLLGLAAVLV